MWYEGAVPQKKARRLSENEKFIAGSRKTKILTAGIH